MTTYRYKGQTKDGTAVSGVIRAYDEFEAASRLRETVAIITRLEEVREKKENIFNRPIGLKIKEKELALICSQFAIILSAGMSILISPFASCDKIPKISRCDFAFDILRNRISADCV